MAKSKSIVSIDLNDGGLSPLTPEIEQERRLAIFDLLEDNKFALVDSSNFRKNYEGPLALCVTSQGNRLILSLSDPKTNEKIFDFILSISPFRKVIREYSEIWASYFDAVKRLPPSKIEAIDMARRGIHNEGAEVLLERLDGKIDTDQATAKRLFTLICVLQLRG